MRVLVIAALAPLLLVASATISATTGCGSPDEARMGAHARATVGAPGIAASATLTFDVLGVEAVADGAKGILYVDTASPVTVLSTAAYPAISGGTARVSALTIGGLTVMDVPVLGVPLFASSAGVLGGDTLCQFITTMNYRDHRVSLGEAPPPLDVDAPGVTVPFSLEGGGSGVLPSGEVVTFPPTRIVVTAKVEGVARPFVVATGASLVIVRRSLQDALVKKGRGEQLVDSTRVTVATSGRAARLRTVSLGDAEVTELVGARLETDELLDRLAAEVGHPIDGLIGGSFLEKFNVVIDYPNRLLRLQRYGSPDDLHDEFRRVGFTLEDRGAFASPRYVVLRVYDRTDATFQGVQRGDGLMSVDGQAVDLLDLTGADRLLRGAVGASHVVVLTRGGGINTYTLRIDELLPLP